MAAKLPDEVLLDASESVPVNPNLYEKITPELIKRVGREMQGSSGLSGLDSEAWKRMLTCYSRKSNRLCTALALAARCLCTDEVSGCHLSAFTAPRLIPLDKSPGVRPIAAGAAALLVRQWSGMYLTQLPLFSCVPECQYAKQWSIPWAVCSGVLMLRRSCWLMHRMHLIH